MFKTMTLALTGLGLTLAACGGDGKVSELADDVTHEAAAAEPPAAEAPEIDPVDPVVVEEEAPEGTNTEFALAANDAGMTDDIDEMGGHFDAIGRYAEDFDFAGAASEARDARALLDDMRSEARQLTGADSPAGVATIEAFDVCYGAMDTTADAMASIDIDALEASAAAIEDCTDAIGDATDVLAG